MNLLYIELKAHRSVVCYAVFSYDLSMASYRKNVAALIMNKAGKLLVCERKGQSGAWQFPQGGVDKGEKLTDAFYREVKEEVGIDADMLVLVKFKGGYKYQYTPEIQKKKDYSGQMQTYFLCRLAKGVSDDSVKLDNKEFKDYKWIDPCDFDIQWLPSFKRQVYDAVMWHFFGVKI